MNTYLEMIADTSQYSFTDKIFLAYFEPEVNEVVREWLLWSADQYEMQTGADPTLELLVERATMKLARTVHDIIDRQVIMIAGRIPFSRERAFVIESTLDSIKSVNLYLIVRRYMADWIEQDDRYQLNLTENDIEYITYRRD